MKDLLTYLRSRRRILLILLVFAIIFLVSFLLYRLPVAAVLYPIALCLLLGAVFLLAGYHRSRRVVKRYRSLQDLPAEMIRELPDPGTPEGKAANDLIRSLQRELRDTKSSRETAYRDMVDYYTVWAHQIKTPIASMKLILENDDSQLSRRLTGELFRMRQYVDMVMAYLRLGSDTTDFLFREHRLDDLVRPVLHRFAPEFISRRLSLTYETIPFTVLTDEKWFSFLLEQFLSNALKYTRSGGIRISMIGETVLSLEDTGIGIAPEDLPRIMEKGYTGLNGRVDRNASGLGLWLCGQIAGRIGVTPEIRSVQGQGTCVLLHLTAAREQNM